MNLLDYLQSTHLNNNKKNFISQIIAQIKFPIDKNENIKLECSALFLDAERDSEQWLLLQTNCTLSCNFLIRLHWQRAVSEGHDAARVSDDATQDQPAAERIFGF